MQLHFHKYHGAGNDFVMMNCFHSQCKLNNETIKWLCHRQYGIGADGLIQILPSNKSDFRMIYYNSDGSEGTMCGNGGRCVALFAYNEKICSQHMEFEAIDGIHKAKVELLNDNTFQVELHMQDVTDWIKDQSYFFVDTGSPHYIEIVENLSSIDVIKKGREIRDSFHKEGTNVNFLSKIDSDWHIRTYERGVEDETLACGTGVTAAAISIAVAENITHQWIKIKANGGILQVYLERADNYYKNIILKGPATKVYQGEIFI